MDCRGRGKLIFYRTYFALVRRLAEARQPRGAFAQLTYKRLGQRPYKRAVRLEGLPQDEREEKKRVTSKTSNRVVNPSGSQQYIYHMPQ